MYRLKKDGDFIDRISCLQHVPLQFNIFQTDNYTTNCTTILTYILVLIVYFYRVTADKKEERKTMVKSGFVRFERSLSSFVRRHGCG